MHLKLDDAQADVEGGFVKRARGVEVVDDLLAGVLRRSVTAGVCAIRSDAYVDHLRCCRATSRLTNAAFEAGGPSDTASPNRYIGGTNFVV